VSILSDFEDRVGRAVEGLFAGVFRSPVQPAELARAAGREMDRQRKLGVGKVYAPTLYSILLSPEDGAELSGFTATLAGELETYLSAHAHEKDYDLATRPRVRFLVDEDLKLGRFQVIGELMSVAEIETELGGGSAGAGGGVAAGIPGADAAAGAASTTPPGAAASPMKPPTVVFDAEADAFDAVAVGATATTTEATSRSDAVASLTLKQTGHSFQLPYGEHIVIGRLKSCEVHLDDRNVSRRHAELEPEGAGWVLVDLGSTNGTLVNGREVDRLRVRDGDLVTIGITELVFHDTRESL